MLRQRLTFSRVEERKELLPAMLGALPEKRRVRVARRGATSRTWNAGASITIYYDSVRGDVCDGTSYSIFYTLWWIRMPTTSDQGCRAFSAQLIWLNDENILGSYVSPPILSTFLVALWFLLLLAAAATVDWGGGNTGKRDEMMECGLQVVRQPENGPVMRLVIRLILY